MRMTDQSDFGSVSALRAQLQEKINFNFPGDDVSEESTVVKDRRKSSSISLPVVPEDGLNDDSTLVPPSPPTRHNSLGVTNGPPVSARNTSLIGGELHGSKGKPPVAPKPVFPKNTHLVDNCSMQEGPAITVTDIQEDESNEFHETPSTSTVLERARRFEQIGVPPISPLNTSTSNSVRPDSTISSLSLSSTHNDISDSDSDEERPSTLFSKNLTVDICSPNGKRRTSSFGQSDTQIHDKIMDQLKRDGIFRASSHQPLFKKRTETQNSRLKSNLVEKDEGIDQGVEIDGIPEDIGKMREHKTTRVVDSVISTTSSSSDDPRSRVESMVSDRNSVLTTYSDHDGVIEYNTGDPQEDSRLKKLHYAANEFYTVQKSYLTYLRHMAETYPHYIQEYGRGINKDLLAPPPGSTIHPVVQMQRTHFAPFVLLHQEILGSFSAINAHWNSMNPCLADVILKYASYLKLCKPFLMEKSKFIEQLTKLFEENKDFERATISFEQNVFKRGVGAIVQQLDQVHQNFMRYKLLMSNYAKHLVEGSEEYEKAAKAIKVLEENTQAVNRAMGLPTNQELFQLYDRFSYQFNIFLPGRLLIRHDEVMKQTRKEPQPRYLLLFSDVLWICRVSSGLNSTGVFDLGRSYSIPIESVRVDDHELFENVLYIKSNKKSVSLIMNSMKERDGWKSDIKKACQEKKQFKRRMSEAIQKERRQSSTPIILHPTTSTGILEPCDSSPSCPGEPCLSRSHSLDTTSQPTTPIDAPEQPVTCVPTKSGSKKIHVIDKDKPVWLPDSSSSKCLMDGCGTVFDTFKRRHHCRDCGFLICKNCCGYAPLSKYDYQKQLVCPECYDKFVKKYRDGSLFPERLLIKNLDGSINVKIKKKNGNYTSVLTQSLFSPPKNAGLKKKKVQERLRSEGNLFNKVFLKTPRGGEVERFAELSDGCSLRFYKAMHDDRPLDSYTIYGFRLSETTLDKGGMLFELIHRNQIQTDRGESIIAFRVENYNSIQKWSTALAKAVRLEEA